MTHYRSSLCSRCCRRVFRAVLWVGLAGLVPAGCTKSAPVKPAVIRVLTDRTASHLENIFKYFEEANKVKIETNFVGDGLIARLESRPQEADLVITKNADLMEVAKAKGLLAKIWTQDVIENVPPVFRDPDLYYTVLSFRARAIFVAKGRVEPEAITSYRDLTLPRWKRRVCIRSGFHEYNVSWWSQMAVAEGLDQTKAYIEALRDNLARPPKGNDRNQVRGLLENECDLTVANSYYMGIMRQRVDQKAWAEASEVVFPEQDQKGVYVMRGAAGLTQSKENGWWAGKLLAFLTADFAQQYFAEALFEYPVKKGVPLAPVNIEMAKARGIEDGAYKVNLVSLAEAAKQRPAIIDTLNQTNFDQK